MRCPVCAAGSRVVRTDTRPDNVIQRRRECTAGHKFSTYEITPRMYAAAQYDIRRAAEHNAYNEDIAKRRELRALLQAARRAGATCRQLAEKHGLSLHMARYYSRLPREQIYPAAKARNGNQKARDTRRD